jgi:transcriptional regulator with XRE-family HTH domain
MTLTEYLLNNGETGSQFARRIDVAQATVHRYCNGVRIPRPEILQRIQVATNGAVTPNDFIGG